MGTGRAETSVEKLSSGGKVVAPGCTSNGRIQAGEEPEDHKQIIISNEKNSNQSDNFQKFARKLS